MLPDDIGSEVHEELLTHDGRRATGTTDEFKLLKVTLVTQLKWKSSY